MAESAIPPYELSSQPEGKTKMDDGRRDLTLLRHHVPARVEIFLPTIPGCAQIPGVHVAVAAADTAHPHDRSRSRSGSRSHTGRRVHRGAMISPLRGQSGGSRESEDSKTDKNAFHHSQLLLRYRDIPPLELRQFNITGTPRQTARADPADEHGEFTLAGAAQPRRTAR